MPARVTKAKPPTKMTPLWVISLFVSLTEVVLGISVTQTTGNIQIALVCFVIIFPVLVACVFFILLWFKPWTFYPPSEYPDVEVLKAFREESIPIVKETKDVKGPVEIAGNPDRLKLLFKAAGKDWERSTKAMDVGHGCVVQMSTKFLTPQGWNPAEAVTYVPDTEIVPENEGEGHYLIRKNERTGDDNP